MYNNDYGAITNVATMNICNCRWCVGIVQATRSHCHTMIRRTVCATNATTLYYKVAL